MENPSARRNFVAASGPSPLVMPLPRAAGPGIQRFPMPPPPFRLSFLRAASVVAMAAASIAGASAAASIASTAVTATAEGSYRNPDNPDPKDPSEGTYPIPYHLPTTVEISADLERVLGFLDAAVPTRIVDRQTRQPITDRATPVEDAVVERGGDEDFYDLDYTMGVVHAGMLHAAEATGDRRFSDFMARQLQFIADALPYFRSQAAQFGVAHNSFRAILAPAALDDCGAMTAALIKARLAGIGPDLGEVIKGWSDFIAHRQFRLADGTLARQRPQAESVWADDFYMGVPALAQMGRMTGEGRWFDDAVRNALQISARLYRPQAGLFTHGWNAANPDAPEFYWGRANGWAMMAMCELLDVLPAAHPGRAEILACLRGQIHGVAVRQSGRGLWHQMLDREDSFLETSASAMFVYGIAHAINQGWISPANYGSIAQVGWIGVSTQINDKGQVENTCVGTTYASDQAYYCNRPVSALALHGYGPVLLAGAEMIRLLENPAIDIQYKTRTYHYVPKR